MSVTAAFELARTAHTGQVDKVGEPYVGHPFRVALSVVGDELRQVGALHDVVEDTPLTLADLSARGFSDAVVAGVDAMTKRPGETLRASMARVSADPLARVVKLADVADNASPVRLARLPTEEQRKELALKYTATCTLLGADVMAVIGTVPAEPAVALSRELPERLLGTGFRVVDHLRGEWVRVVGDDAVLAVVGTTEDARLFVDDTPTPWTSLAGAFRGLWAAVRPDEPLPEHLRG